MTALRWYKYGASHTPSASDRKRFMNQIQSSSTPRAFILADPNGAGKTTFAREFLIAEEHCSTFINADLIAAGLSPFDLEKASIRAMRLIAEQMHACVRDRQDFAVESTLSGRTYAKLIQQWQKLGYQVKIIFLKLNSEAMAIARVKHRVKLGGHNIPEDVIRRRYRQGWQNFQDTYRHLADAWQVYDAMVKPPVLIDEGGEL